MSCIFTPSLMRKKFLWSYIFCGQFFSFFIFVSVVGSYPNNQSGLGPPSSTNTGGFPSMGSQPNMAGGVGPSAFPSSSIAGANQSQISATANHNMTHASPATPMARYSHRGFQTQTRGALSAMLSNSNSTPGQSWTASFVLVCSSPD